MLAIDCRLLTMMHLIQPYFDRALLEKDLKSYLLLNMSFPSFSSDSLPEQYRALMKDPNSPLSSFYPEGILIITVVVLIGYVYTIGLSIPKNMKFHICRLSVPAFVEGLL